MRQVQKRLLALLLTAAMTATMVAPAGATATGGAAGDVSAPGGETRISEDQSNVTVTVHYHREDGDYSG